MSQFWDDLGVRVATTALVTPVAVALWKWCEHLWHRWYTRRLRRKAERYARAHGNRVEVALVLSIGKSILEAAREHLRQHGRLGRGADIPIEEVHQPEPLGESEGQWFAYLERVKQQVAKAREMGAVRVYVYTSLPVAMALMVGATLTNGPEVVVHHYANGPYIEVGKLRFETVRA